MNIQQGKLRVGILGTGKIGTDLLLKIKKSPYLQCVLFAGRNPNSEGIKKATELGIPTSLESINAFENTSHNIQLVFDATSAEHHRQHAPVFERLNIKVVDLTPARVGPLCVPLLNEDVINTHNNVNMITCGGQSSIPIIEAVAKLLPESQGVSLQSMVSEDSIGQATLDNIDDYYSTTASAISQFTGIACTDVKLEVKEQCNEMTNIIRFSLPTNGDGFFDGSKLTQTLEERISALNQYVPGYRLICEPLFNDNAIEIRIAVRGQGDWIPEHAGNLDIINCAALRVAEMLAVNVSESASDHSFTDRIKSFFGPNPAMPEEFEAV